VKKRKIEICNYGVFVRFSTRGVQKHPNMLFGGSPCQNLLAEKAERKNNFFPVVFPLRFFWPFFCIKSDLKVLKKSQKDR
jgi:hypothetical protein